MKSVYDYRDYRKYMADYYREQKELVGFSWRDFSHAAGFGSPVFLKLVSDGKSGLSKKARVKVAESMGLEGFDKEYFVWLVEYNQAKNANVKSQAFAAMQDILLGNRVGILEKDFFEYYSIWLHSVIRELSTSVKNPSPKELARLCQFKASAESVGKSLKFLTKRGFIKKSTRKGQFALGKKSISTGTLPTSVMSIRNFHRQMGALALESLDSVDVEERNFSTITLGLNKKAYDKIVKEIANFRKKIVAIAARDAQTERVYEINLQLFPLSKLLPKEILKGNQ